jgi:hypothetical protein
MGRMRVRWAGPPRSPRASPSRRPRSLAAHRRKFIAPLWKAVPGSICGAQATIILLPALGVRIMPGSVAADAGGGDGRANKSAQR